MPFKVYPVHGMKWGFDDKKDKSYKEVAEQIQSAYENAVELGGRIVGSHVLDYRQPADLDGYNFDGHLRMMYHDRAYTGNNVLFLVAEIPESTS